MLVRDFKDVLIVVQHHFAIKIVKSFIFLIYQISQKYVLAFDMNSIDSQETVESIHHIKLIVVIFTLSSGGVFMLIGITISIYRFLYYKSRHPHNFSVVANGENVALVRTN